MRKILLYILFVIIVSFFIPCLFTKKFEITETVADTQENVVNEEIAVVIPEYQYQDYNTIKLLHANTNQIEEVNLDDYLCNVVSAEMPADYEKEALKAQAIVARTYTIYKIANNSGKHEGADICSNSACCQAWISKEDRLARWDEAKREENWNKITSAVGETVGKIITYEGKPINAFFHSNSGGKTEIPLNVWGGSGYPYLQVVETYGEEAYSQYASEAKFTKEELIEKIKTKYSDIELDALDTNSVQITERTESNRVKTLKIGNKNLAGVEARTLLGLKSTNFTITIQESTVVFSVIRIWAWSRNESDWCRCTCKTRIYI